jgi:hypothetical protein
MTRKSLKAAASRRPLCHLVAHASMIRREISGSPAACEPIAGPARFGAGPPSLDRRYFDGTLIVPFAICFEIAFRRAIRAARRGAVVLIVP